ncbi:MAG: YegS/Rv2252/BmrU family lipid kinase [Erysipelotrichaceae bacterium]|nr:YegS/Rv2252/BmrU family lipid kinase [Erysipelotrichaceae bacterium]MBQ1482002.1 YegS/Rv2252/BmrU family lipid kinase [Erysipelotrichaceae bacterium]
MKLLLLINARSGLKNSKADLVKVIDIFCAHGYDVSAYVTQKQNDAYEYLMKNRVRYDVVCVFGGDGTMNEVTNALMRREHKPLLGYFPSGTMNDFGSNFDLGNDFVKIAERICEGNVREFDVGKFNDRYFNYVAAFGAMCDVPFTTNRDAKEMLGNIAYIMEGIMKLPEVKMNKIRYTINNRTYKKDVLFGLIYSGNRVAGMELEDKKRSRIDDGLFNVLIVDYVPTVFNAPDLLSTLLQQDKFIHRYRTKAITLEFEDDVVWTLDGEEAKVKDRAEISITNKALRILA